MINQALMDNFLAAWAALDIDAILDCFTEDAVYINIPIDPPNNGKQEMRAFIEGFTATCTRAEFIVHHQTESPDGRVLMNERTDHLQMGDTEIVIKVMGVFEFRDGKICAWRDYFDMAALTG